MVYFGLASNEIQSEQFATLVIPAKGKDSKYVKRSAKAPTRHSLHHFLPARPIANRHHLYMD